MTNSEARKRHATPPTPDALDVAAIEATWLHQCGPCDAGLPMGCVCSDADPRPVIASLLAALDEAQREVERLSEEVMGHQVSEGYDKGYEHGSLAGIQHYEREKARATAAESARDAAEGAIERVRAAYVKACKRSALPNGWTVDDWEDFTEGLLHDVSAALAPVTTDETEGGGES